MIAQDINYSWVFNDCQTGIVHKSKFKMQVERNKHWVMNGRFEPAISDPYPLGLH